jgi:hypothetical protein
MGVPTTAHFIYIPFVLLIGIVIGFILGGRAAKDAQAAAAERERARAERKARRAAASEQDSASSQPK